MREPSLTNEPSHFRAFGYDAAVAGRATTAGQQWRSVESFTLHWNGLQVRQKSKTEWFKGHGFEIRMQQMRENLQGYHVSQPSQTTRVRRCSLRSLPYMRSQIQAQIRLELAHRGMPEKTATYCSKKRRFPGVHRGAGIAVGWILALPRSQYNCEHSIRGTVSVVTRLCFTSIFTFPFPSFNFQIFFSAR